MHPAQPLSTRKLKRGLQLSPISGFDFQPTTLGSRVLNRILHMTQNTTDDTLDCRTPAFTMPCQSNGGFSVATSQCRHTSQEVMKLRGISDWKLLKGMCTNAIGCCASPGGLQTTCIATYPVILLPSGVYKGGLQHNGSAPEYPKGFLKLCYCLAVKGKLQMLDDFQHHDVSDCYKYLVCKAMWRALNKWIWPVGDA